MRRKNGILIWLCIVAPLVLGTAGYLIFRPDTWLSRRIMDMLPFERAAAWLAHVRIGAGRAAFFRNYFSDICWAFSLGSAVSFILPDKRRWAVILPLLFLSVMEGLQKTGVIRGTFDWLDILLESIASTAAVLLVQYLQNHQGGMKHEETVE